MRATEGSSLLILGTYRGTEVDEAHPLEQALAELRRARALETIALPGLGDQEVAALISSQAGRSASAAVVQSIVDRTGETHSSSRSCCAMSAPRMTSSRH